jgi:hypothetical protein
MACETSHHNGYGFLLKKLRANSLEGMLYIKANYTHDGVVYFLSLSHFDITNQKCLAKHLQLRK